MTQNQRLQMPLIIPPLEIRPVVEKTAEYVSKNGSQFEEIIYNNEKNNPQFSFLKLNDPYRAYYDKKVIEFTKNLSIIPTENPKTEPSFQKELLDEKVENAKSEVFEENLNFKFAYMSPSMTILESEIIKLTAFYVSLKGEEFLEKITRKESQNPKFAFLKTTNPSFLYFTNLVESYLEIRDFEKPQFERFLRNTESLHSIINRCAKRREFEKQEIIEKRQMVQETNKLEDTQGFDWNNFTIVETVDLDLNQFHVGKTDSKGNFHGVDPRNYLGKKGIDPEFAFLAEGLKMKKVSVQNIYETKTEEDINNQISLKPEISFKPLEAQDGLYKCTFCSKNVPIGMFEAHNQMELKLQEKKVHEVYKPVERGNIDYEENLKKMIQMRANMQVKQNEDKDEELFKKKSLSEVAKPRVLGDR